MPRLGLSDETASSLSPFDGDDGHSRGLDELFTPPFVGERRLVVVESADDFVSRIAGNGQYVGAPSSCGVLLLDVRTWPATTRIAKAMPFAIEANAPKAWHAPGWASKWATHRHGKELSAETAKWLVELVGTDLGVIDQELAKLSAYLGDKPAIDRATVDRLVAGTRVDAAFKLLEMVLEGDLPSPSHPPPGCRFHTRCRFARTLGDKCFTIAPDLKERKSNHHAACHLLEASTGSTDT